MVFVFSCLLKQGTIGKLAIPDWRGDRRLTIEMERTKQNSGFEFKVAPAAHLNRYVASRNETMSTTFSVYPHTSEIPTFSQIIDLSNRRLHQFLSRCGIDARPRLNVVLRSKKPDLEQPISQDLPARWRDDLYAWFYIPPVPGGTDAYFRKVDDEEKEIWLEEIETNKRVNQRRELILSRLEAGHFWNFRRSMGQPAIINLAYGLVAASVAELTDGFIYSGDNAWDYERFPAIAAEFDEWYFRPEETKDTNFREWSERCIRAISAELTT